MFLLMKKHSIHSRHLVEQLLRYDSGSGYHVFFIITNDVGVPIPSRHTETLLRL